MDNITTGENEKISKDLADMIFALGLPISIVEHPQFVTFMKNLRPAYLPRPMTTCGRDSTRG